jgi:hypothetical protein
MPVQWLALRVDWRRNHDDSMLPFTAVPWHDGRYLGREAGVLVGSGGTGLSRCLRSVGT